MNIFPGCVKHCSCLAVSWMCCQTRVQSVLYFTRICLCGLVVQVWKQQLHISLHMHPSYHSSQLSSKSGESEVYWDMSLIYTKHWCAFSHHILFIKFLSRRRKEQKQILLIFTHVADHFHSENNIITQHYCIKDIKVDLKFKFSSLFKQGNTNSDDVAAIVHVFVHFSE